MSAPDFTILQDALAASARWIEPVLEEFLDGIGRHSILPANARYCLSGGGKRVRPFLVGAACRASGADPSRAVHAAAAVEMIHVYSLIHDDLPALDDDELRRGRPTLHVMHGSPQALLSGDFLLSGAFSVLLRSALPPSILVEMASRLASAAGPSFLVGGQYMDMNPPGSPDEDWAGRMIDGKTAAMIRVSLELGALAGGLPPASLPELSAAGDMLGLLFQMTDDLLDVQGTPEEMGKAVGKDAGRGKANLVSILGLRRCADLACDLAADLDQRFAAIPGNWGDVRLLVEFLPERRN